ncbi:acyl-CoA dehydrogenase family protein [Actinomycetospora cinnamomea]|uniref:Alkylation response protein AidB-like acyl-CoA dehydrogenase n=1 Tax=Actinomycetospora cinnamomea TaxID=663609 RepID=A0A2U1E7Z5_9PSEU|nr:acyl-CoA dehydrogenase family protein [Actinomycetospora cinnamomea]PVY96015.1 alkylation response protein AidB-like acyl-CoA dehydrogenase [Actinomycetospora cinnamomea]
MTSQPGRTDRVTDYTRRFAAFLDDEVAPLEADLAERDVGTPWNPRLDEAGRMHPAVWEARREVQRRSAAAGLYNPHVSVAVGGGGFSRAEMQHVEEFVYRHAGLGLGLAALAWTEGANPALEHCSDAARERWLAPLMAGEITAAFANTEISVGTDVLAMETRARRDGSDWILDGTKAWITNAHFADVVQVTAVTEPGAGTRSLSMFLVDASAPGFTRGRDIPTMLDDGLTGELHLDAVRVPAEHVVGEVGDGFGLAMAWINWRRLCRGGMCAGWGEWLLARALDRAQRRTSGGAPIAELQAVQHMLADMDADVYAARAASLLAQSELDALPGGAFGLPLHADAPRLTSLVKVINDEAFFRVADRAVQVHGGTGLRLGSPEEKLFRLARNLKIPAGTVEIQRNAIARGLIRRGTGR